MNVVTRTLFFCFYQVDGFSGSSSFSLNDSYKNEESRDYILHACLDAPAPELLALSALAVGDLAPFSSFFTCGGFFPTIPWPRKD